MTAALRGGLPLDPSPDPQVEEETDDGAQFAESTTERRVLSEPDAANLGLGSSPSVSTGSESALTPESSEARRRSVVPGGLRELASTHEEKAPAPDLRAIENDADVSKDPAKRVRASDPLTPQDHRYANTLLAWSRAL